jgi:acyl carrier protein
VTTQATSQTAEEAALASLIVQTLNLEVASEAIDPDGALYGEGLGLDSIDMLEISLAVSQHYGVKLRAEDKDNVENFQSLRMLNRYIQGHRAA